MSNDGSGFLLPENTVKIGSYTNLKKANDHALVILSMGTPYWMVPDGDLFHLYVNKESESDVHVQLKKSDIENLYWPPARIIPPRGKEVPLIYYLPFILILSVMYYLQESLNLDITELGKLNANAVIIDNEWWRCLTALTLHSDLAHLFGNLGLGCFFAYTTCQIMRVSHAWFLLALSGFLGNFTNAWFHHSSEFSSIGASTAVFGAIGIVVGNAIQNGIIRKNHNWKQSIAFPLFIAFVMLGWWGSSGPRTDVTAHLFGMTWGIILGFSHAFLQRHLKKKIGGFLNLILLTSLALAWGLALNKVL